MKKYYLQTFGCQMNKNDSERIGGVLATLDYHATDKVEKADLIIVNTCSVRQSAEDRVFGLIHNWQTLRENNRDLIIAITGCMPGRDKDGNIKKKIKGIDLFFGIEELPMLPKWLRELNNDAITSEAEKFSNYLEIIPNQDKNYQAFVTIQSGCNNFCTYCVVPYARGREKNRSVEDILAEVSLFANKGCKEVTLLGQVVNNYKISDPNSVDNSNPYRGKDDFATLLWEINKIKGVERINYTAADPQYFSEYQIDALGLSHQVNYLHLPVQSGDNEILRKMNRKYTAQQYIDLIAKIKKNIPNIAIGTDIIVGFPSETEEQFKNTIDLYKKCDFDICYTAMYSERSGTVAAKSFSDDVSQPEKKKRWQQIQELMEQIVYKKNKVFLGKTISVLVDDYKDGVCFGRSSEMKLVSFLGKNELVGSIANVEVSMADVWILKGVIKL